MIRLIQAPQFSYLLYSFVGDTYPLKEKFSWNKHCLLRIATFANIFGFVDIIELAIKNSNVNL